MVPRTLVTSEGHYVHQKVLKNTNFSCILICRFWGVEISLHLIWHFLMVYFEGMKFLVTLARWTE